MGLLRILRTVFCAYLSLCDSFLLPVFKCILVLIFFVPYIGGVESWLLKKIYFKSICVSARVCWENIHMSASAKEIKDMISPWSWDVVSCQSGFWELNSYLYKSSVYSLNC